MASVFHSYATHAIGTTPVTVYAPSSKAVMIGLTICNIYGAALSLTIQLVKASGTTVTLVNNQRFDTGKLFDFMAGNKLIVESGDSITAVATASNAYDIVVSALEGVN
jgi:hypothetical protein